jgi:hypothetical protein
MAGAAERMWELMLQGSNELANDLGLESPPAVFTPARALGAVDGWLAARQEPLEDEETAKLGFFLARILIENHDGGMAQIRQKDHPLDGEWAITGFSGGLAEDYHVPFVVSAVRIGVDRSLTAEAWYAQTLREGK